MDIDLMLGSRFIYSGRQKCWWFIVVGEKSFIDIGANTIQSITIGNNCTVGGGSIIIKDIPENSTVVGNPGKIINRK